MDEARVCNAREHGLKGDGQANDQPALAALVDELGRACKADGRPRGIFCPPRGGRARPPRRPPAPRGAPPPRPGGGGGRPPAFFFCPAGAPPPPPPPPGRGTGGTGSAPG